MNKLDIYQNEYSAKADESTDLESLDSRFNERRDYFYTHVFKTWIGVFFASALCNTDINKRYWSACIVAGNLIPKLNEKFKAVEASFENLKETVKNR